jgi:hypothetical protein
VWPSQLSIEALLYLQLRPRATDGVQAGVSRLPLTDVPRLQCFETGPVHLLLSNADDHTRSAVSFDSSVNRWLTDLDLLVPTTSSGFAPHTLEWSNRHPHLTLAGSWPDTHSQTKARLVCIALQRTSFSTPWLILAARLAHRPNLTVTSPLVLFRRRG